MKVVAVIQARMGSKRFPGKMMHSIAGQPLIRHILQRVARLEVDERVLATTTNDQDTPLVFEALAYGVKVFRGSEENVLERVIGAAAEAECPGVVRVCGDSPLWDADEANRCVEIMRNGWFDLVQYHGQPLCRQQGISCVSVGALLRSDPDDPRAREHVCQYAIEEWKALGLSVGWLHLPAHLVGEEKLSIDTPEDLVRLELLIEKDRAGRLWTD